MKKNILILFGGASSEHEISCISASFIDDNTDREKYNVYRIGITKSGAWWLYNGPSSRICDGSWEQDTQNLLPAILSPCSVHHGIEVLNKANKTYEIIYIDAAFPVLHGKNGEDGTMQGLLQLAGIPFVGPSTYASAVCMDKLSAKILCKNKGIRVAPFIYARKSELDINRLIAETEESFDYPVFVKPANGGSSIGVSKVKNRAHLVEAVNKAFENDSKILIEKAINGKEVEAAVFSSNDKFIVSFPGEIDSSADFYDYEDKYINGVSSLHIPARISEKATKELMRCAEIIFRELDCDGLSRVDFFVDGDDVIFNEINTIPGFTSISMYPRLMEASGLGGKDLIDALIASAQTH